LALPLSGCLADQEVTKTSASVEEEANQKNLWDFGKVKQGELVKHEFVLKNASDKPMKIKEVNTSCGCTASEVKKRDLAPGDSTLIEVTFDSAGYSGPVKQFVFVNTDNPGMSMNRFTIKADVER
jgi:hypothetical protein